MMDEKQNFFAPWLNFNDMLTPRIIEIVYMLGLIGIVLISVVMIVDGEAGGGIILLLCGSIAWRIWCELMIVVFKINENIQKIANQYKE